MTTLCDSMDLWPARLLCPGDSPGKNIGVGCHVLLQGIFLTQGSNPGVFCLLHWQTGSLPLALHVKLPRWLSGKESACQGGRHWRRGFDPWVGKIPWSRKWQPTPVLLPRKSHGQRSLAGYSPWGCKELDTT